MAQQGQLSPGLEQVIGKAIGDPAFRQEMVDNPEQAVKNANIQLSSQELQAITGTSREEREKMINQLSERTSPWWDGWFSGSGSGW